MEILSQDSWQIHPIQLLSVTYAMILSYYIIERKQAVVRSNFTVQILGSKQDPHVISHS